MPRREAGGSDDCLHAVASVAYAPYNACSLPLTNDARTVPFPQHSFTFIPHYRGRCTSLPKDPSAKEVAPSFFCSFLHTVKETATRVAGGLQRQSREARWCPNFYCTDNVYGHPEAPRACQEGCTYVCLWTSVGKGGDKWEPLWKSRPGLCAVWHPAIVANPAVLLPMPIIPSRSEGGDVPRSLHPCY